MCMHSDGENSLYMLFVAQNYTFGINCLIKFSHPLYWKTGYKGTGM